MRDILKIPSDKVVWFTSDTHYWHKNIVYGESVWANKETGTRRFDTTKEMSQHIVSNINDCVGEDDILIHLGDWSFGGIDNIWNFRKQIKCKNIYLVIGNHDTHIRKNYILPNVHRIKPYSSELEDGQGISATDGEYPDYVEAQDLFVLVEDYLEIMIGKDLFCCMHYPMDEWNDRHHKSYMLHGHQHGNNTFKADRLDVGLDSIFNILGRLRPIRSDEAIQIIKQQKQ